MTACSIEARYLHMFLSNHADREGRLEDKPTYLKGEIFPADTVDVRLLLDELCAAIDDDGRPLLVRYEVGGKRYLWIPDFHLEQQPHIKEQASKLPAPGVEARVMEVSEVHGACTVHPPGEQGACPPVSGIRYPVSGYSPLQPTTSSVSPTGFSGDGENDVHDDGGGAISRLGEEMASAVRRVPKWAGRSDQAGVWRLVASETMLLAGASGERVREQLAQFEAANRGRLAGRGGVDPVAAMRGWMQRASTRWVAVGDEDIQRRLDAGPYSGQDPDVAYRENGVKAVIAWDLVTDEPLDEDVWRARLEGLRLGLRLEKGSGRARKKGADRTLVDVVEDEAAGVAEEMKSG